MHFLVRSWCHKYRYPPVSYEATSMYSLSLVAITASFNSVTFIWLSELMHGAIHIWYVSSTLFGDMYFSRSCHSDVKVLLDYYCWNKHATVYLHYSQCCSVYVVHCKNKEARLAGVGTTMFTCWISVVTGLVNSFGVDLLAVFSYSWTCGVVNIWKTTTSAIAKLVYYCVIFICQHNNNVMCVLLCHHFACQVGFVFAVRWYVL